LLSPLQSLARQSSKIDTIVLPSPGNIRICCGCVVLISACRGAIRGPMWRHSLRMRAARASTPCDCTPCPHQSQARIAESLRFDSVRFEWYIPDPRMIEETSKATCCTAAPESLPHPYGTEARGPSLRWVRHRHAWLLVAREHCLWRRASHRLSSPPGVRVMYWPITRDARVAPLSNGAPWLCSVPRRTGND
jgi:hypothetical protein